MVISHIKGVQDMSYPTTDNISVIISPKAGKLEKLAAKVFSEEILRKTGIEAKLYTQSTKAESYIVIATQENLKKTFPNIIKWFRIWKSLRRKAISFMWINQTG